MTAGLPFPRAAWSGREPLSFTGPDGRRRSVQTRVLDRWSDGSVRWALVDGMVDWSAAEDFVWLGFDAPGGTPHEARAARLAVVEQGQAVSIDTGAARFVADAGGAFPFARVIDPDGRDLIDPARGGLRVRAAGGEPFTLSVDLVTVEERGPVRASLRWQGRLASASGDATLDLDARAEFFAGLPIARLRLTIRNPRGARHPGNFWELGDEGSVFLRDVSLAIAAAGAGPVDVACSIEHGAPLRACGASLEIYQESSGGAHWNSRAHVNRDGRVPMGVRGYVYRTDHTCETGLRATPVVTLSRGHVHLGMAMPCFWQNFPRSIEVRGAEVVAGLWPGGFPDLHELQGGEQKTHDVTLAFGPDPVCALPLDWCRAPALLCADPAWYCGSGAVPHLIPEALEAPGPYRALVRAAIEGDDTFVAKRERVDEYGWRHFGDIYADHEAVRHRGDDALVSHYNNQYDAVAGFAVQFLRSGDPRWWTQMCELAAHVVDIDVYHTADDKSAYAGGPFWHTSHYVDAGRSTHRSYPKVPGVSGGGPSCEHNYTGGLLLHHFLTGRPESREAVIGLADWVLRIDDGATTIFRWLARGDTGLASATRDPGYHGPGRGAAHSIAALLDAHRLTGAERYARKAEQLIRRCVHPRDDLQARRLLDVEERWSYTIFLQALGRYLDECAERGATGAMYGYAQASLLHYARWMAAHEQPYLDTPERLEFPTETWAAHDMRKCEVLLLASLHARDAAERAALRERAAFFYRASTETLMAMPTRTLARPVVIMLTNGYRMPWFRQHLSADAPGARDAAPPVDAGRPQVFVPQRQRAIRRAAWVAAAGAATALLLLLIRTF